MDQGDAAVWAAALGIAGTLGGALGGALVQGWVIRRQVRDQEGAEVRHRLRDERRTAYTSVLDRGDDVATALDPIVYARVQPDWRDEGDHRELWAPANAALSELKRAATAVAITGPDDMASLALEIHDAAMNKANAMRSFGLEFSDRLTEFNEANESIRALRQRFVDRARDVLKGPSA